MYVVDHPFHQIRTREAQEGKETAFQFDWARNPSSSSLVQPTLENASTTRLELSFLLSFTFVLPFKDIMSGDRRTSQQYLTLPPISHLLHPSSPPKSLDDGSKGHQQQQPTPTFNFSSASPVSPKPSPLLTVTSSRQFLSARQHHPPPPQIQCGYSTTSTQHPPSPLSPSPRSPLSVGSDEGFSSLPPLEGNDPPRPLRTYNRQYPPGQNQQQAPQEPSFSFPHQSLYNSKTRPNWTSAPVSHDTEPFYATTTSADNTPTRMPASYAPVNVHHSPYNLRSSSSHSSQAPSSSTVPSDRRSSSTTHSSLVTTTQSVILNTPVNAATKPSNSTTSTTAIRTFVRPKSSRPLKYDPLAPSTEILFTEDGEPFIKRRRGRPPIIREAAWNGGDWTFMTPTVWNVNSSGQPPTTQQQQQQSNEKNDPSLDKSLTAFTNSDLDTVLQMPKKKRGRKPKTQFAGNSCFVWKDLTAKRSSSSSRKHKPSISNASSTSTTSAPLTPLNHSNANAPDDDDSESEVAPASPKCTIYIDDLNSTPTEEAIKASAVT